MKESIKQLEMTLATGKPDDGKDHLRCPWGKYNDFKRLYHDDRWCRPLHDDNEMYALIVMETMSVGLSFSLILSREAQIYKACDGLVPSVCAEYGPSDEARLMKTDGMIHNLLKVSSIGNNARAFLRIQEKFGSFDKYLWDFVDGNPIDHKLTRQMTPPTKDGFSEKISKDLKGRGFSFMGPVITYSYLQAVGIVNDHVVDCPWHNH